MIKQTLKEKIKLSENLVDKYLNELDASSIYAVSNAVNTAQGIARDVQGISKWAMDKIKERKQKQMLAKQEKEKQQQQVSRNKNIA